MKYRKLPLEIDAHQIPGDGVLGDEWRAFCDWMKIHAGTIDWKPTYPDGDGIDITTLEGVMRGNPGDWVIRGVQGELYPCKPDIFAATYEPADGVPAAGGR